MSGKHGHFCHVCNAVLPNEAFSGKGHARHVCKQCQRLPREEREAIDQIDEIHGFMEQSHISRKNVTRLKTLILSPNAQVAELADIVLQVDRFKAYKKQRMKLMAEKAPELLQRVKDAELGSVYGWVDEDPMSD